jgi:sigma-70-like protein
MCGGFSPTCRCGCSRWRSNQSGNGHRRQTGETKPQEDASEGTFADLVEAHRREIQTYCYRMLGSYDDAEGLVQDVLLRACGGRGRCCGSTCPRSARSGRRRPGPQPEEKAVLDRYMRVTQDGDVDAMAALLTDATILTMPPNPFWFVGREAIATFPRMSLPPDAPGYLGAWRGVATSANRQPAVGRYLRRVGTTVFRAQVLDDGRITQSRRSSRTCSRRSVCR